MPPWKYHEVGKHLAGQTNRMTKTSFDTMRHKRTIWISLIYFGRKENASTLNPPCHKTPLLLQRSKAIAALPLQWHQREQANQHLSDPGGLWRQDDRTSFHERSFFGSTCFAKGPTQLTAPQARHSKLKQYQNSQIRKLKLKLTSVYQSTAFQWTFVVCFQAKVQKARIKPVKVLMHQAGSC